MAQKLVNAHVAHERLGVHTLITIYVVRVGHGPYCTTWVSWRPSWRPLSLIQLWNVKWEGGMWGIIWHAHELR